MCGSDRLVDLSHEIGHGTLTYRGLPGPVISEFMTREQSREHYSPGTEFSIGRIEMVSNTGTYLDSPFHRYPDGTDLAGLPLEKLANLEGLVVRAPEGAGAIGPEVFEPLEIEGRAVLVHTGWDTRWSDESYFSNGYPFLTAAAARLLRDAGAALVGTDSYNIDDTADGSRPAHSILLGAGIPVVEHMTGLAELPGSGFRFFAVPVKIRRFGTFPVRAFAITEQG